MHGDKRGRSSASRRRTSCRARATAVPGHGVYACRARRDGEWPAAVNVGVRPIFETGRGELIEAYLLDFDGDLYGQPLRIEFLKRLRGERRFDSVDGLVEQMGARRRGDARAWRPELTAGERCLLPSGAA